MLAINLVVKKEVGFESSGSRGIDSSLCIFDYQFRSRRFAIVVNDFQADLASRIALEQNGKCVSKADIGGTLPHVKRQLGFALPGIAAVKLYDAIFDFQTRQCIGEWTRIHHLRDKPAILDLTGCYLVLAVRGAAGSNLGLNAIRAGDS